MRFCHGGVEDHADHPHLAAAATAHQNVLAPHPLEELSPGQTAVALGRVGAGEVVGVESRDPRLTRRERRRIYTPI